MKTNEFTYKVMDLNTAQLEIPRETYQRELSPDRVRRIVKAFDERIANEPKVSYRGGHYYVFDGQHTIAARKLRNDNQDLKVRCKVYFGMSDKDEALLFAQQTGASAKQQDRHPNNSGKGLIAYIQVARPGYNTL